MTNRDPFGFTSAIGGKVEPTYFALIDTGKAYASATPCYTKKILNMFLADNNLKSKVIKILPSTEFEKITGRKP